jgi:hypothetical protein
MFQSAIEQLVAAFNRGSLDVPAGLLTPQTIYSLNGRSYESILGGSPDDPLIRLLARGAGGYRSVAKALLYALPQPTATVISLSPLGAGGTRDMSLLLQGRLRHTNEPFDATCTVKLTASGDSLAAADVVCDEEALARIADARR